MSFFSKSRVAVAVGVSVLLLSSCSSKVHKGNGIATLDSAASMLVPMELKGKTLTVATDATYAPDEFINDKGEIDGFNIEMMNALATTLGITIKHVSATFDNIIPGIQSGQYAIGNSSFTDTLERQKSVTFVNYFEAGMAFYVKKGTDPIYDSVESLCGTSVSVESGTIEETEAQAQAKKCPTDKPLEVHSYNDQNAANLAVSSGRDMVGFLDSQIAGYVVEQSAGQFVLSGKPFGIAPYGIAVAKTETGQKLAEAMQTGFKVMYSNGVYQKILEKWGVQDGGFDSAERFTINGATS